MDFTPQNKRKITKWIIGIAVACIVIFLGLQNIGTAFGVLSEVVGLIMPLILGFVFALILNVPMSFFEKHIFKKTKKASLQKLKRPISFIISVILIIAIIVGVKFHRYTQRNEYERACKASVWQSAFRD